MDISYNQLAKAAMSHIIGYNPELDPTEHFKQAGMSKKDLVNLIWESQVTRKPKQEVVHYKNKLPARGHYIPNDEPSEEAITIGKLEIDKWLFNDKAIINGPMKSKYKNYPDPESFFGDIAEYKFQHSYHMNNLQRMMLEDCIIGWNGGPIPLQVEAVDKTPYQQRLEVIAQRMGITYSEADIVKQSMQALNINLDKVIESGLSVQALADLADEILKVEIIDPEDVYSRPDSIINYEFWCTHQDETAEEPDNWLDEALSYDTDSNFSTATTGFIPWLGWHDKDGWHGTGSSDAFDEPWVLTDELKDILSEMYKAAELGDVWKFDDLREQVFSNIQFQDRKGFWAEYKVIKEICLKQVELVMNREYYETISLINSAKSTGQLKFYGAWLYCQSSGTKFSGNIKIPAENLTKPQLGVVWKLYKEKQQNLIAYYGMEPHDIVQFLTENY